MMDQLRRPDNWERVSRREWAVFGIGQQLCSLTLLVVLYVFVSAQLQRGYSLREVVQNVLGILTGLQLALLHCRLRKLRGGE